MGTTITDHDLVVEILAGNTDRLRVLVTRYEKPLHAFICRVALDPAAAEDIFVETFTRAYLSLRQFDATQASFKAWLYAIAVEQTRGHPCRRHPRAIHPSEGSPADRPQPEEQTLAWGAGEWVAHAVAALPRFQRDVFVLHQYEGLDYHAIANLLRHSPSTVRSQMHQAFESLRKRLHPLLNA